MHRSSIVSPSSLTDVTLKISGQELREVLSKYAEVFITSPESGRVDDVVGPFNAALSSSLEISARFNDGGIVANSVDYGLYKQVKTAHYYQLALMDGNQYQHVGIKNAAQDAGFGSKLLYSLVANIYRFYAERPNVGRCPIGHSEELKPDASNLAEVLQVLQTKNSHRYERFNRLVTEIFPTVKWVSAVTDENADSGGKIIEIKVWPVDRSTERDYLAIPLTECGTGIGQALAILYIIVNSEEPRVIIIDEPQSFLHPGAARKLIELLNKHPEHQYFISTHSPELLAAAKPSTITSLQYVEGESIPKSLTLQQKDELKRVLDEVGVKFSDVFFAEEVLWVEGPTEHKAFPLIIKKYARKGDFSNITILPLTNTGDLKSKKHARLVFDIYRRLSGAHALVPPTVGVILDREGLSQKDVEEFERLGQGLLELLPRRMFENYLLDPEAIAAVFNKEDSTRESPAPITAEKVESWIEDCKEKGNFLDADLKARGKKPDDAEWLSKVDAAKLLAKLFRDFSNGEVSYDKTEHSVALTSWLLDNKKNALRDVWGILEKVFRRGVTT